MRTVFLAASLVGLGFIVGYGFHNRQSGRPAPQPNVAQPGSQATPVPPEVKGLRASPDGKTLAFAAVSGDAGKAWRVLFDLETKQATFTESPRGWQDYTVQWSHDGRKILFDRERIPRDVGEATPGLHEAEVTPKASGSDSSGAPSAGEPRVLAPRGTLPAGEKSFAGFWTPDGTLVIKTRREPKSMYTLRNDRVIPVDRGAATYYQNRAVTENGKTTFYVVRDLPGRPQEAALFRTVDGRTTRLSEPFGDTEWVYVAEDGRWMVVCRDSEDDENWEWTMYRVTPQKASRLESRAVTKDVNGVFWSPDRRHILGASGQSLWLIDVPSLQSQRLGEREDWNADDATWLPAATGGAQAVIVAAAGKLWRVEIPSGQATELWEFPKEYWSQ